MSRKTQSWKIYLKSAVIITGLYLTCMTQGFAGGDEWIEYGLTKCGTNFPSFIRKAIEQHEPFIETVEAIEKRVQDLPRGSKHYEYFGKNGDIARIEREVWAGEEGKQTNPLLKAVCIRKHLDVNGSQEESLALLDGLVGQLLLASEAYKTTPTIALQLKIMAAREAERISHLQKRHMFKWPIDNGELTQLVRQIHRPVLLWTEIAKSAVLKQLDVDNLQALFPAHLPDEDRCHDIYIFESQCLEKLLQQSILGRKKNWWEDDEDYLERMKKEDKTRKSYLMAFKSQCYLRAQGYRSWHFRVSIFSKLPSFKETHVTDLKRFLKTSKKASNTVATLADEAGENDSKFYLNLLAAELMSYPFRVLSPERYGTSKELGNEAKKVITKEQKLARAYIKDLYKEAVKYKGEPSQQWHLRLPAVRAMHGLAMLTKTDEKKRARLQEALEWSILKAGEHDPTLETSFTVGGFGTTLFRYNLGDLQVKDHLILPTWDQALRYRINELGVEAK